MSKFFIERPILANVIAIITILLGAVCLYNLRPILMTSIAFILGVVPLLTATGAGAASQ